MKKKMLNICFILLISLFFIDIVGAETYNNNYSPATVSCGGDVLTGIPTMLPKVVSIIYTIIQIAVPIVLVIMGMLDLFKGVTAQKEDNMKKSQQMFIKRLITAAIVFFVFIAVKLVVSFASDKDSGYIFECAECFINNKCN